LSPAARGVGLALGLALGMLVSCGPGEPEQPPAEAEAPAKTAESFIAELESGSPEARLEACRELARHGEHPLVVGILYRRMIDEQEQPAVRMAAAEALMSIDGPVATKHLHAFFVGRPGRTEIWNQVGAWLVQHIGAETMAADLASMSNREDYDKILVLEFARRHSGEPALKELAAALELPFPHTTD
jgi:hypothetical protein